MSDFGSNSSSDRAIGLVLAWGAMIVCFGLYLASQTTFHNLPDKAYLYPDNDLEKPLLSLVGVELPYEVVNWAVIRQLCMPWSIALWMGYLVFKVLWRPRQARWFWGFFVCSALVWDSALLPASWSVQGPLQVVSRILPGYNLISLNYPAMTIAVLILINLLFGTPGKLTAKFNLCFGIVVVSLAISGFKIPSIYQAPQPSQLKLTELEKWTDVAEFNPKLSASDGEVGLGHVLDSDINTRWTVGGGGQRGGEWIEIKFPGFVKLKAIRLEQGNFTTDYPRGLLISDCEGRTVLEAQFVTGERQITPDGQAYFVDTGHSDFIFESVAEAKCLKLEQIGFSSRFDWSVVGIKVLQVK